MSSYLDNLDSLLAGVLGGFRLEFRARQAAFTAGRQLADGGFPGREGGSDLYYSDFALRVLALAGADGDVLQRAACWLAGLPPPRDVVECFCLLNAARSLRRCGIEAPVDRDVVWRVMQGLALPGGGFPRHGGGDPSAYATFLAALACEMLEREVPERDAAVDRVRSLRRPDGGYADLPGQASAQTSATAAAVGFLGVCEALGEGDPETAAYLSRMQRPGSGLRAHAGAPEADLLSTFTGLVTLSGLDALDAIDVPAVARFVRECAAPDGGFHSGPGDGEPDVEYTYYGMGTLALLRAYAEVLREG